MARNWGSSLLLNKISIFLFKSNWLKTIFLTVCVNGRNAQFTTYIKTLYGKTPGSGDL